ncbi:MAG: helix-turn-helix transcriptional regulator [Alphaproteobacteria bacterium]|nr:helix-turn-helix transcriptional regulator [Alphaproteobacteria bacterium]
MINKRTAQEISDSVILKLKEERMKQGISQYRIAKDTGMSKSSILYIENLTQRPTLYTVILLANYLKIDLKKIL